MPSLVQFGQLLDPMKKTFVPKYLFEVIRKSWKFTYEDLTFF